MGKLLLMSILFSMVLIPTYAAREKSAEKGLRKAIRYCVMFNFFYLFVLLFLYGRF